MERGREEGRKTGREEEKKRGREQERKRDEEGIVVLEHTTITIGAANR